MIVMSQTLLWTFTPFQSFYILTKTKNWSASLRFVSALHQLVFFCFSCWLRWRSERHVETLWSFSVTSPSPRNKRLWEYVGRGRQRGDESRSANSHPAVCRPHWACFWISDQKFQWRPPPNPNICCHIAVNNWFVDPTVCTVCIFSPEREHVCVYTLQPDFSDLIRC